MTTKIVCPFNYVISFGMKTIQQTSNHYCT